MSFSTPAGATLVRALGAGSVFDLAIVRVDGRECICKRLRVRMIDEPAAQRALAREGRALELFAHRAVPELLVRGNDEWEPSSSKLAPLESRCGSSWTATGNGAGQSPPG